MSSSRVSSTYYFLALENSLKHSDLRSADFFETVEFS